MTVVTRFPPSPTGFMHIGNARTALYNWLFARHHGGQFLLRIEDTDRARHSEEAVTALINGLNWLELAWDGDVVSQFSRQERHVEVAQELLAKGMAYKCYCSPEELDEMREKARAEGRSAFYDRRWRDRDPAEAPGDIQPVIRVKAPIDGEITIEDQVQGQVTVKNETLDDFIILRSDGTPTYMLAVVCDDHDMGVTHVIRGSDHLNNAFRQKVIIDAMDWDTPVYAHLPLIVGEDGSKFSKRHGAASVEEYRDMGYLPEAMRNYLLRLGWGHGDEEIIPTERAIELFTLEGVGQSPARFDFAKLESLNSHYLSEADNQRLVDLIIPLLKERYGLDIEGNDIVRQRLLEGMDELKDRAKTLLQLTDEAAFYAKAVPFSYDEKASTMLDADAAVVLQDIRDRFEATDSLTPEAVEQICRDVADALRDGKLGKVAMPLRAALTGTTVSPSVFHAAAILGKDECLQRLDAALNRNSGGQISADRAEAS